MKQKTIGRPEFYDGFNWFTLATINDVNFLEIKEEVPEQTCIFIHKINII